MSGFLLLIRGVFIVQLLRVLSKLFEETVHCQNRLRVFSLTILISIALNFFKDYLKYNNNLYTPQL